MLRLIVDAQLPPALAAWLCRRGHQAVSVREIGLRDASDEEIWKRAEKDGAVLVTKDADFRRFVMPPASDAAVVWVRIGNASNGSLLESFERTWGLVEAHLLAGSRFVELR